MLDMIEDIMFLKRRQLPIITSQIIKKNEDAISFCQFSPDGRKLAIGSNDETVSIYNVDPKTLTVRQSIVFGYPYEVYCLSWSPNSKLLMACGPDSDLWMWDVSKGVLKLKLTQSKEESINSCCWFSYGESFVFAGSRGHYYQHDLNGSLLRAMRDTEASSILCGSDKKTILAADIYGRIRSVDLYGKTAENVTREFDDNILSFTSNKTDKLVLVHFATNGIHLWDLQSKRFVKRYEGVPRRLFNSTIHSCFGGSTQEFFASGGEDNNVHLWHIKHKKPLAKLTGHTNTVRCVSWNPVYHQMLASVSDDCTVRIWVTASSYHSPKIFINIDDVPKAISKGRLSKLRDVLVNTFSKKYHPDLTTDEFIENTEKYFEMRQAHKEMVSLMITMKQLDEARTSKVDPKCDHKMVSHLLFAKKNCNEGGIAKNLNGQTKKYLRGAVNKRDIPTYKVPLEEDIHELLSKEVDKNLNTLDSMELQLDKSLLELEDLMTKLQEWEIL